MDTAYAPVVSYGTLDAPVVSIWTILDAQNYISEGGPQVVVQTAKSIHYFSKMLRKTFENDSFSTQSN